MSDAAEIVCEWVCPECGYQIDTLMKLLAIADFDCRCGKAKWSDFVQIRKRVKRVEQESKP